MNNIHNLEPDTTATRVALWRYNHLLIESPPHIFTDQIGFKLVNPNSDWQKRPDMDPRGTEGFRASIVARARFVEDFVRDQITKNLEQYVILGAGLDTFAQRQVNIASKLKIYEIDQPETQQWKINRLQELGIPIHSWLHFVPVNFETDSWWKRLLNSGFDVKMKSLISSLGVSMYISKESTFDTLQRIASLCSNSTFIMTYLLPIGLIEPEDQISFEFSIRGASKSGTPFISFYTQNEIKELAKKAGFKQVDVISTSKLRELYFLNRKDGFRLASGEEILVATT